MCALVVVVFPAVLMIWVQWAACTVLITGFFTCSAMNSTWWPKVNQRSFLHSLFYVLSCWERIVFQVTEVDRRDIAEADLGSCNCQLFRSRILCKWALLLCLRDRLILLVANGCWTCCISHYQWLLSLFWILYCFGLKNQTVSYKTKVQRVKCCLKEKYYFFLPQRNNHLILMLVEQDLARDELTCWVWVEEKSTTLIWCITLPLR